MALMVAREVPTSSTMAVPHGPASVGAARRRLRRDLGDRKVPAAVIDDAVLILSELLSNSCRYARPLAPLLDLAGGASEEFRLHGADMPKAAARAESADAAAEAAALEVLLVSAGSHRHARAAREPGSTLSSSAPAAGAGPVGAAADPPAGHGGAAGQPADPAGGVLVRWQMHNDGLLTLEVTDGGATTRPLPASPSLTAKGGRGLSIVGQLAADWGVRDAPGEVTVWAALPARAEQPVRRSA
ncbi:ATP-binding protein [Kitasatospora sp. NPDC008050]|uniref:ATP-binding protein n=1 Tax=Kitasatospora sp. NPDC008050 TaxID=3364021 RepID=UPI0036DFC050